MTDRSANLWAAFDVVIELESIGDALDRLEQQYGSHPLIEEAWHRQQRALVEAFENLRRLNPGETWPATHRRLVH